MLFDRITLKQGKTHSGQGLIAIIEDPITLVVTDADADFWSKLATSAESIEMRVSPTSKYESRVLLVTFTAILLV